MHNRNLNETDELFKRGLENLPEESPDDRAWTQLFPRLKKEGVIAEPTKRRTGLFILSGLAAMIAALFIFYFYAQKNTGHSPALREEMAQKKTEKPQQAVSGISQDDKEKQNTHFEIIPGTASVESEKKVPEPVSAQIPTSQWTQKQPSAASVLKNNSEQKIIIAEETSGIKESKQEKTIQQNNEKKNPEQVQTEITVQKTFVQPTTPSQASENKESKISSAETENAEMSTKTIDSPATSEVFSVAQQIHDSSSQAAPPASEPTQNTANKKTRRFYIGYYAAGDFNHYALKDPRHTKYGESAFVLEQMKKNTDTLEKQFQFTTGLTGGYNLSNYFSIETGVLYSQKKKLKTTIYVPKYNTEYGESATDYTYYYNAQYLEVFGRLKYYFTKGRLNYYIAPGLLGSFNCPVREERRGYFTRSFYGESATAQTDKITLAPGSLVMSMAIAAGVEMNVSERWKIYFEPSYKYAFNPVIRHQNYDQMPANHFFRAFSLGIGCLYRF